MNERDRVIGRLLLEKGLATREALQQAAATTTQRRTQSGTDVDLLMVMVELGLLDRPSASQIWREVAAQDGAPVAPVGSGAQVPGSFRRAGSADSAQFDAVQPERFSPTGALSNIGADDSFSANAPTLMGNFDVAGARAASDADESVTLAGGLFAPGNGGAPAPPGSFAGVPPAPGSFAGGPPPGFGNDGSGAPPSGFGAPPSDFGGVGSAFGGPGAGSAFGGPGAGSAFGGPPPAGSAFGGPPPAGSAFGGPPPAGSAFGGPGAGSAFGGPGAGSAFGSDFGGAPAFGAPGGSATFGAPPPGSAFGGPPPGGSATFGAPPPAGSAFGGPPPGGSAFGGPPPGGSAFGGPPPGGSAFGGPPAGGSAFGGPPPGGSAFGAGPGSALGSAPPSSAFGAAPGSTFGSAPSASPFGADSSGSGSTSKTGKKDLRKTRGPSSRRSVAGRRSVVDRAPPANSKSKTIAAILVSVAVLLSAGVGTSMLLKDDKGGKVSDPDDGTKTPGGETGGSKPPKVTPPPPEVVPPGGIIPDKPDNLTPEKIHEFGESIGDRLLGTASDLAYEQEKYDDAVRVLERFPEWLRSAKITKQIELKRAKYAKFSGFRDQLVNALKKGAGDPSLKSAILRVSKPSLPQELAELPCVARFKEDARSVLGDSAYDALELEAANLDEVDDMNSEGFDD